MTVVDQPSRTTSSSAFADELRVRLAEAETVLHAADALGEGLLAQIAAADLADLRSLAARNDVDLDAGADEGEASR